MLFQRCSMTSIPSRKYAALFFGSRTGDLHFEIFESKFFIDLTRQLQDHVDLGRNLIMANDVMCVILCERTYAKQTVQFAGFFDYDNPVAFSAMRYGSSL